MTMLRKAAIGLMKYRFPLLVVIAVITGLLSYKAFSTELLTDFNDLLPYGHPYVDIHTKFRERFGGANLTTVVVQVKEGNVFNMKTLEKIQRINKAMYQIPNINNLQVASIADRKIKNITSDAEGLYRAAVMWPNIPKNEEEIEALKQTLMSNEGIYGQYLSFDMKMLLLSADFWERAIDYRVIFAKLQDIVKQETDENHIIRMVGEPVLYGWVYHYMPQMIQIFLITFLVLTAVLYVYSLNLRGVLLPIISGVVSAAWGMGLAGLLGYHVDPLIMVIPFLITARVIAHSLQMLQRFDDEIGIVNDPVVAAERSFYGLFPPAFISILTDAAGIFVVIVTPIPLLDKLAIVGGFWTLSVFVSVVVLDPLILSYLPPPKRKSGSMLYVRFLRWLGRASLGRAKWLTLAVTLVILVVGAYYSRFLVIGDITPGSPILWDDSVYNQDQAVINANFPGSNQMYIVFDAKPEFKKTDEKAGIMVVKRTNVLRKFEEFQRYLESMDEVAFTISIADVIRMVNMKLMADNPRWDQLPMNAAHSGETFYMLMASSEPGDLDRFTNFDYTEAAITAYFKDRKGETIRTVIAAAKDFIAKNPLEEGDFFLAGGVIGVLAAINEVIFGQQALTVILALLIVLFTCWITYRSFTAGILFTIPLAICNYLTYAYMAWKEIGLNINTMPVAALGIGLGINYGIYVVSRVKEDYHESHDLDDAILKAMETAGQAVFFTGATLIAAVIFWYFLSDLRFQAEMGLLLAVWTLISMLQGILLIPTLISVLKPKFIYKQKGMLE